MAKESNISNFDITLKMRSAYAIIWISRKTLRATFLGIYSSGPGSITHHLDTELPTLVYEMKRATYGEAMDALEGFVKGDPTLRDLYARGPRHG